MPVYDENVPRQFSRTATVTGVLPSRDSEIIRAIVRIAKTKAIFKRPVNKLFPIENTYRDINQTVKARNKS